MDQLPPPAQDPYYRSRTDQLMDHRLTAIERGLRDLDRRADALDRRLNLVFGALAVVMFAANIIGPVVAQVVFVARP
jgi:hypothetical protein